MTYQYCARIIDGVVTQIVESNNVEWLIEKTNAIWIPVYDGWSCGVGWTWDGEQFLPPETEEVTDEITD